jgi:Ca2+-binding EF-hand superfamily protein
MEMKLLVCVLLLLWMADCTPSSFISYFNALDDDHDGFIEWSEWFAELKWLAEEKGRFDEHSFQQV